MIMKRIISLIAVCIGLQQSLIAVEESFFTRVSNRVYAAVAAPKTTFVRGSLIAAGIVGVACAAYGYYVYCNAQEANHKAKIAEQKQIIKNTLETLLSNGLIDGMHDLVLWSTLQQEMSFDERIAFGLELQSDEKNQSSALAFAMYAFNEQEMKCSKYSKLSATR